MSLLVPIGPQHPALPEPERFIFKVDGEVIVDVDVKIGFCHRGVEKLMTKKTYVQNIYLSERICGICNVAHTTCYVQLVEKALDLEVPERAQFIRVILNELARIHSHLLIIGITGEEIGFETLFMYMWRDREIVMRMIEDITGNRVISALNTIGGVRRDISEEQKERIKKGISILRERFKRYQEVFTEDPTVRRRLCERGIISRSDAISYGAVGPVIRGSGVKYDVRICYPYQAYDRIPFDMVIYEEGDSLARVLVRIGELFTSADIVEYALDHLPKGDIRVPAPRKVPENDVISVVEAPRGELFYHLISDGTDKPYRLKVRTPTFSNIYPIARAMIGETIPEIPAILISMDPCFSCMDRLKFIDIRKGKVWIWSARDIRRHYKRR